MAAKEEKEETEQPNIQQPSAMQKRLFLFGLLAFMTLSVFFGLKARFSTPEDRPDQTFVIDEPGLTYFWITAQGLQRVSLRLEHVPIKRRAGVIVFRTGWPQDDRRRGRYIADVMDKKPGDKVTARWTNQYQRNQLRRVGDLADMRAREVALFASEIANFHPDSDRQKQTRKVIHNFEENVKPRMFPKKETSKP